jgi:dipeptidyl aminopeptidase/acylaminoacyl peptidase
VRDELERVEIPGEDDARERAWAMLARELEDRVPTPQRSHWPRVAAVAVALAAALAAALSPPGQAVIDEIREVVGVERAERALFSLPSEGRLLVAADTGVWVVQRDGSKRLLEGYREASWSPFGRFVVATREAELAALEPDGKVRWTLARRGVRSPRWTGTETDTRIAYVDRTGIRVVAGDGTGDRGLSPVAAPIAWKPDARHVLASLHGSELRLQAADTGRVLGRPSAGPAGDVLDMSFSPDGRRALVVRPRQLDVVDVARDTRRTIPVRAADALAATFSPDGRTIAVLRPSALLLVDLAKPRKAPRRLFAGAGPFSGLAWSPDGRWLLLGWPAADQWIFVRADGKSIRAVSNISGQFRSRGFPRVDGWCCAR